MNANAAAAAAYLKCLNSVQQPQNLNSSLNVSSSNNENPMMMRSQISSLAEVGEQSSIYHSVSAAASMNRHRY
jgi:hypothetical protein